jgi:uncharacterized protein (DUF1697 family)
MRKTPRATTKLTYVALLRGINVGGYKPIKMDQLRDAFVTMGFEDVKTYVQSGNVAFKAPSQACENLAKRIQENVFGQFGISVSVLVKTPKELNAVMKNNPFLKETGIDTSKLHVTFLSRAPEKNALKMLASIAASPDQFRYSGEAIYLYCPNGYGETKLSNNALEKMLKVAATTRNWKTVNQLYEMSLG